MVLRLSEGSTVALLLKKASLLVLRLGCSKASKSRARDQEVRLYMSQIH